MKKWMKGSFLFVGISLFTLVAAEGIGRLVIRYLELKKPTGVFGEVILSHQEPLIGFGLKKNLDESMGSWHVRTNALGMRDKELSAEKAPGEYRVFLVGGSTTFGWGVDEKDSIPGVLQTELEKKGHRNIRVINAGVPWYASWHEAALIFFRIFKYQPDHIIMIDGLNDVAQGIAPEWAPVSAGYLDPPTRVALAKKQQDPSKRSFLLNLMGVSQTFTYFTTKMKARQELKTGVYHPELWDQFIEHKDHLNKIAKASGVRFTTVFQPVIVLDKELTEEERKLNETSMRYDDFADTFRRVYLSGETRLLEAKELSAISLRDIFKEVKETVYIDGQHYNALGNRLLAKAILEKEILPHLK